jgi:hypothetical protein
MNAIYLRRRRKVYVKDGGTQLPLAQLATLQKNIESLGFICSQELLARLQTLSPERIASFYKSFIKDLQELVGAHRVFKPMYPNFPDQVMQMSQAELYYNAVLHYLTNRLHEHPKQSRPPLIEETNLRVIDLGTKGDFEGIFTQLAGSRTSLSPQDKQDVSWFVAQYRDDIARLLPKEMPIKENLAVVGAALLRHTTLATTVLADKIRTATDVLRLAVALSDGDVSLAEPTRFTKFRRGERKQMLAWLEATGGPTEDMLRWPEPWKRLGERLHPGDYSEKFPKTFNAFDVIRNDRPFETFNRRIEGSLSKQDTSAVLELLQKRPGDLARRLDHLLRFSARPEDVVSAFAAATDRVSTPVLLQVLTHFRHRDEQRPLRPFFPKGEVAKVYATTNRLSALPSGVAETIASVCGQSLLTRFARLPPLGKCYLDPQLTKFLVPFSQRSASKALRTLVRGSRLPLPECEVVRFFLWWKNGKSRTDIDLSAAAYDADFKYVDVISYYNLKSFGGCHSGDIVDAPQGASEFIDLNVAKTLARGVRYIVMSLNSFTSQPYCDLPECFAGWMARDAAGSGEIFEPKTVQDTVDVAANTRICIPAILDLASREVIWADIALRERTNWNNVHTNLSGVSLMLRSLTSLVKTDLHTLFALHIRARGQSVADPTQADTVFAVQQGITPFDLSRIAAEFM